MSDILFRMAAKTDVGLVRDNNEDNFQAASDLSQSPMRWTGNQQCILGEKGALLVVADGMGGQNAGEVASEIAIATVRERFAPEKLTDDVMATDSAVFKFLDSVITDADRRMKQHIKTAPDAAGMGTTFVTGWLLHGKLYIAWCGDSRAYIYNPVNGLFRISKDHSYVQELVDAGKISETDAFDFPDSNIITRSLSATNVKAVPEHLPAPITLCQGDIVLLCSDGLCGMMRDSEIEDVIRGCQDDMSVLVDRLIDAAKQAAGADNVTVAVAQILSGGAEAKPGREPFGHATAQEGDGHAANTSRPAKGNNGRTKAWLWPALLVVAIAAVCAAAGYMLMASGEEPMPGVLHADTVSVTGTPHSDPTATDLDTGRPDTTIIVEEDTVMPATADTIKPTPAAPATHRPAAATPKPAVPDTKEKAPPAPAAPAQKEAPATADTTQTAPTQN